MLSDVAEKIQERNQNWVILSKELSKPDAIQFAFRAHLRNNIPSQELAIIRDQEKYRVIRQIFNIDFLPEQRIQHILTETKRVNKLFDAMEKSNQKLISMNILIKRHLPYFRELYNERKETL